MSALDCRTETWRMTLRAVALIAACAFASVAAAQSPPNRTFASAKGDDANPCSRALPCRTFQKAVDAVASGGEVHALDVGEYGAITINKAVSIEGHGWARISVQGAGNSCPPGAVNIIAGARVILRNLFIENLPGVRLFCGISVEQAHSVVIEGVTIRNATYGIYITNSASVAIRNSTITGFEGISMHSSGSARLVLTLDKVNVRSFRALSYFYTDEDVADIMIINSSLVGGDSCIRMQGILNSGRISTFVRDTLVSGVNQAIATFVGDMRVGRSTVSGPILASFSNVRSYGDNTFPSGAIPPQFTATIPRK